MARDHIVRFAKRVPTREELQHVLEDYFSEVASRIRWDKDRFFVTVRGVPADPFRRVKGGLRSVRPEQEERWIEVWGDKRTVDVITRCADELTNALADELATCLARFYQGKREKM